MQISCSTCLFLNEQQVHTTTCQICSSPLENVLEPWHANAILGYRYRIIELIGVGGNGHVCVAWDILEDRHCVLKIYQKSAMKLSQVTAFLNEAIQVRNFAHPNIVTTYGGDIDGDIYYIVQEWICGFDLANYEDKIARFTLPQLLFIMLKTTEALEYMWTNFKFVHRDIKPENILINNKGRVILTDFGIMSPELECDMNDSLQCTPHYVPPETVTGEGKIDFRSDIYSLGATFFKLISGKTPFYGTSAIGVIEQRIFMPPPDLRAHVEVSDAVAEMIMTCMAISASDRYQNFNYLKNALRRCMSNLNPPKAIKMTKTNYVR